MLEQFQVARRRATPLIHINTMDPEATQLTIGEAYKPEPTDKGDDPRTGEQPLVAWDSVRGMRGLNSRGIASARGACSGDEKPEDVTQPVEALRAAAKLADRTIFFCHNPQLFLSKQDDGAALMVQAIKNLRDPFKTKMRQLVMLGPWCFLPPEINQDVMVIDEALPADTELEKIVLKQHKAAGLSEPDKKTVVKAVDALRGLATFPAEQVTAMSLISKARGLDMEMLWERKRQTIEQTPGLSIWRGAESFDDIKGYDNAANFLKRFFDGKRPPKGVMFMDEID